MLAWLLIIGNLIVVSALINVERLSRRPAGSKPDSACRSSRLMIPSVRARSRLDWSTSDR
jgi:hypothetical protein